MDILKLREEFLKKRNINQDYRNINQDYRNINQDYRNINQDYRNINQDYRNINQNYKDEKYSMENVNELFERLSEKINNIEMIEESLINEINKKIQGICKNHNQKISNWYDEKYDDDLKIFKTNNENFKKKMMFNESNSFVSVKSYSLISIES